MLQSSTSLITFYIHTFKGIIYFSLANLDPAMRSQLGAIHLVCVFKNSHVQQYGLDPILVPFLKDIDRLSQVI